MIRSVEHLKKFAIVASDGRIGSVDDFYFDDDRWAIRYLVVDTGGWLPGPRVLISPVSVLRVEWGEQRLILSTTREQVRNSPGIETHKPVSRQQEMEYLDYYGYPYYWGHGGLWGAYAHPMIPPPEVLARQQAQTAAAARKAAEQGDSHLRSAEEVAGYVIRATDGDLGHVDDFLFSDVSWAIRYLVVDTSNWWFGTHVLVAPEWILDVAWADRSVSVGVTRQQLKDAPRYERVEHVNRQWEEAYHQHMGQPGRPEWNHTAST